uniref:Uncharacterized protein n=1 Tax=Mola mola TaxID=94237 RepID=A0A3Q4BFS1_MOLML
MLCVLACLSLSTNSTHRLCISVSLTLTIPKACWIRLRKTVYTLHSMNFKLLHHFRWTCFLTCQMHILLGYKANPLVH